MVTLRVPIARDNLVLRGETHCAPPRAVPDFALETMGFAEEFYLHIQGGQKGPYTFADIKNLYDRNLIAEETLYWRDGLEQWQPVSELCGPTPVAQRKHSRKKQAIFAAALILAGLLAAYFGPMLSEGWKESGQDEFTAEAAYWAARGVVRDEMKKKNATVSFERFAAASVDLTDGHEARVSLPGTIFGADGRSTGASWIVPMHFDAAQKNWRLADRTQIETTKR